MMPIAGIKSQFANRHEPTVSGLKANNKIKSNYYLVK